MRRSENLDFSGLKVTKAEFQQAIIDDLASGIQKQTADLIDKSLDDKSLAAGLRKAESADGAMVASAVAAAVRTRQGERPNLLRMRAKIANIADRFSDAPSAVTRMASALRELDDVESDLQRRKPPNLDKLLSQLSEARSIVGNSLSTSFDKLIEREDERARIADLIATGRRREAAIAEKLASLGDIGVAGKLEQVARNCEGFERNSRNGGCDRR